MSSPRRVFFGLGTLILSLCSERRGKYQYHGGFESVGGLRLRIQKKAFLGLELAVAVPLAAKVVGIAALKSVFTSSVAAAGVNAVSGVAAGINTKYLIC